MIVVLEVQSGAVVMAGFPLEEAQAFVEVYGQHKALKIVEF